MLMTKRLLLFVLVSLSSTCVSIHAPQTHYISFDKPTELHEYLRWRPDRPPLLSAHRGGPSPGFPENCIATFERSLHFAPCLIECDVQKSKDGVMVLMHDRSLDRTTTGKGLVESLSLAQLRQLNLVDANGTVTEYKIPTLLEALRWAEGRAILELDIKSPVTPHEVVQAIKTEDAENRVVAITYDLRTAELYHSLDGNLVLSCSAKGTEGVTRLLESSIPAANLIAFVGVYEPPREVYTLLHENAICAILGTMGNLDRKARRNGIETYIELLRNGTDILATDEVELASEAITRHLQNRAANGDGRADRR
jgi:glycerophosphoryl diester phosphodiesterase